MSITGLDLAAWIIIYLGASLIRTGIIHSRADHSPAPTDYRPRIVATAGWGLLVLGVVVFAFALHRQHHHAPPNRLNPPADTR